MRRLTDGRANDARTDDRENRPHVRVLVRAARMVGAQLSTSGFRGSPFTLAALRAKRHC
jgi:hypothetical protein